ncbi:cytochrome P450 [Saccharopolyspora rhizosphaerae]|uniref:Cytochrome P450 n=1 Tax=Saccharopolyspora rhizosphaerae TaxID=2492662 RepID=A0A426JUL0_9PSEU|nr:cytochrome P450 [Saccharopolyspora rhizosphaerae]RRO16872.1 cytochrome P450 [Saccharopolyspora rhizosphaerae]
MSEYPMQRASGCPLSPPPPLRALAAEKPLHRLEIWDGSAPWVVTGHAEQRALLSDPRVSVNEHLPGFPHFSSSMADTLDQRPKMVFNLDGDEHSRFRRIMTRAFTVKRITALRPRIQQITDELIDALLAGEKPADLVQQLALPLPSLMISELLGVPYHDHDFFQRTSRVGISRNADPEEHEKANRALTEYLVGLVRAKADDPGEDVCSDLAERVGAGEITELEAALIGVQLLVAGHETSANMIALGTAVLLDDPDQLAVVRAVADDPKLIAGATEELLRHLSIPHVGQRRIATADIDIAGETIREGEGIIIDLPLGNWDPAVFPEPERIHLGRDATRHQTFGFGPHNCVGQQLARAELQTVYGTLFRRIPTLTLAVPFDELDLKHDALAFGVHELPVTW